MPRLNLSRLHSFFQAAADSYRQAPWQIVEKRQTIKVECEKYDRRPRYAAVMGQIGPIKGLLLCDDWRSRVLMEQSGDEFAFDKIADQLVNLNVYYEDIKAVRPAELAAARKYGLEIADSAAYPCVYRKEPGCSYRRPDASELALVEGCLRAVPVFVNRHKQDDPTKEAVTVSVASGQLTLGLSWVSGVENK
jgi:hypothetical protein